LIDIIFQAAIMDGFMGTGISVNTWIKFLFAGAIFVAGATWFFMKFQEGYFS
tara:strand:+ start:277 stop:432 length:156 start_codon:yes stop_codon:yes gene_type:complete